MGCVHTKPPFQLVGLVHQDVDPCSPCDGRIDSQEDACGAETESNRALSCIHLNLVA